MTVCIASDAFDTRVGGVAGFNRYLCENLLSQGHAVVRLTMDENAGLAEADQVTVEDRCTTVVLRGGYQQYKKKYAAYFRPGGYSVYGWIAMGLAMKDWLLKNYAIYKIDVIETGDWGGAGVFLVQDGLPPVIITGHSSAWQLSRFNHMVNDAQSSVLLQLERLSYRHAAGIIAHSPLNVRDIETQTGKKVFQCRAPWIIPVDDEAATTTGKKLVVSGLQLAKGAETMAEAVSLIAAKNSNCEVNWIGGDTYTAPGGKLVSAYLANKYPAVWAKHFKWSPEIDHAAIVRTIAGAGVCIIPSVWETFNYFALEAVVAQKPLIITATTGAAYLFENDPNVKIIPANDPAALAKLLSDENGLQKWQHQVDNSTRERVMDHFSAARIVEDRLNAYQQIINDRQPGQVAAETGLQFLDRYTTTGRKWYYGLRRQIKKLVKKN
jgi:glycosyltransferase involved in cell wall biosynthesis